LNQDILRVKNLNMHFPIHGGILRKRIGAVFAVNDVSFTIKKGETLGIVGESGCGKTTLGRALVRLYEPTSGEVIFDGKNVTQLDRSELKAVRRDMQMIFQDPYGSLNPRMSIKDTLLEPLTLHNIGTKQERIEKVMKLIDIVGLRTEDMFKFPHEFSGGQRQRIGIARALALGPKLVIADEPVSALDVSIQSQVLNLLVDLQKELGLTYIFISHDLTVVKYISNKVAVMYLGRIVELANADEIYLKPLHPYTKALLNSVPIADPSRKTKIEILEGDVPSPSNPPSGCPFRTRCKFAKDRCKTTPPPLESYSKDHLVACHFVNEINHEGGIH
jgi:oligopeptide/dipeptide ABC transporter ATP-binding protein